MVNAADTDALAPSHPRENPDLFGHDQAERALIEAYSSGRLAHGWLITGPRGIGKATLAYRFARYLLNGGGANSAAGLFGEPGASLHVDPDADVFRRITANGHGGLTTVERSIDQKTKKLRGTIAVDDIRRLHGFFGLTATEGGWRIAVVDAADEMNNNAANALLKILEEPPARAVLLLVAHAPGRLPATIRSRCRLLPLRPLRDSEVSRIVARHYPDLTEHDLALVARLAGGSPGRALALAAEGGVELYRDITGLLDPLPDLDIGAVYDLADRLTRADDGYRLFTGLVEGWLADAIKRRAIAGGQADRDIEPWTRTWDELTRLIERCAAVNLDKRQVVVTIFTRLQACMRETQR
ncbi:MAG: DNA polymerase III subunit delta' [Sphingomonadales bacterium]